MLLGCYDIFLPTNGVSIKPLKVQLFAGDQKATEFNVSKSGVYQSEQPREAMRGVPTKRGQPQTGSLLIPGSLSNRICYSSSRSLKNSLFPVREL